MTGEARRRAFLLGCNSEGLEHCERDAQRLQEVLTELDYLVADCLTGTTLQQQCTDQAGSLGLSPVSIVTESIRRFLSQCQHGDTALVYFSGHSLFSHDVFNLVVGEDVNDTGDLLSVASLVELFKQHNKPAERLLILDCCEAAEAAKSQFWSKTAGVWARIWVAVRTNEHAQELDAGTDGGLFTAWIIRALTTEAPRLAKNGCLKIGQVDQFVRDRAQNYYSNSGKPAPGPGVYGGTAEDILLAEDVQEHKTTGFLPEVLTKLRALLRRSGLDDAILAEHYQAVLTHSGLTAEGSRGPTDAYDQVGLEGALHNLAVAWYRPPVYAIQVPLAEFVTRVARAAPAIAEDLNDWLRSSLRCLADDGDTDKFIASLALGRSLTDEHQTQPESHLAVALWPADKNTATQYDIEARLVDADGTGNSVYAPVDSVPIEEMPATMRAMLNAQRVRDAMLSSKRPLSIELFLPPGLLRADVDDWTPPRTSPHDTPLCERYIVTVRALNRLGVGAAPDVGCVDDAEPYIANWRSHWDGCNECRERKRDSNFECPEIKGRGVQVSACCVFLTTPLRSYRKLLRQGVCIVVLGFEPSEEQLDLMLRNDLASVLWSHEALAQDFSGRLIAAVASVCPNICKRPCFSDLPYALLHLRQDTWEDTVEEGDGHTGHYHLLWDDAHRLPAFGGRRALPAASTDLQPALHLSSPV